MYFTGGGWLLERESLKIFPQIPLFHTTETRQQNSIQAFLLNKEQERYKPETPQTLPSLKIRPKKNKNKKKNNDQREARSLDLLRTAQFPSDREMESVKQT